jgi:AcrR family transcriptional regulator
MQNLKEKQAAATRQALVAVGRRLFAARGFLAVPAEEITASAGVTRGALYHHFEGKKGLFEAVVVQAMSEVQERLAAAARKATSPVNALERGIDAFLRTCSDPDFQRILLVDGPAVLGWHNWRRLDLQHGIGLLREGLRRAHAAGELYVPDLDTASHLLAGALIDGAMVLAEAEGSPAARRAVEQSLIAMLRGFARDGGRS